MQPVEIEATVTERGQTTVPAAIRRILGMPRPGGTIVFRLGEDGQVTLTRKAEPHADPVIGDFLAFLERDMRARPDALRPVTAGWLEEAKALVANVELDLDAPLPTEE